MGAAASLAIRVQLAANVWTDITPDTDASVGLRIRYGIEGNGPTDCVAGTGECEFTLKNDASNSGAQQGYYSPNHASKRSGWTFGIPVQVAFTDANDASKSVSSITRASQTATVTTGAAHGYATDDWVTIAGAGEAEYNGVFQITVTGATTFTYTVGGTPATPATGTITARKAHVKHRGKAAVIDPDPGQFRTQRCSVVAYDGMRDLAEADAREVALQVNKTETELVSAVLDSLPSTAQPVARDFDVGVDTLPYAFDDLGGGVNALSVIHDVCLGSAALYAQKGDGTHILRSRSTRAVGASAYTFTNTMHGLSVPSTLDQTYNLIRVKIQPKVVESGANDELYTLPTGHSVAIPHGETIEVWTDYTDPNDRQEKIGGANVVTALVGGTHYSAFENAAGTGTNLTASITAAINPFASTAKWTFTNNHATLTAYITLQKVLGDAVRSPGPQTFQSYTAQDYGVRALDLDLRYQDDANLAQSYADYIKQQYQTLANQIGELEILANDSADFMAQALAREIGDVITITEAVTGLASIEAVIHSVELEVTPGPWIICRWGLAPAAPFKAWVLGITGRSEMGETTRVGF